MDEQEKLLMEYLCRNVGRYDKPCITHFKRRKTKRKKVKDVVVLEEVEETWFGHVLLETCETPVKPAKGKFVIGAMSSE